MKKYLIPTALLLVTALSSCTKTIDEDLSGNERSLLELRVEGQMGTAIIDRDGSRIVDRSLYRIVQTPKYSVPTSCGTHTPDRSTNGSPTMRASSKPPDNRSTYARARTKTSRSRRRSIC